MIFPAEPSMFTKLHHYRDTLVLAGCLFCIMVVLLFGAYWFSHGEEYEFRRQWLLLLVIIPGVVHAYLNRRTLWPKLRSSLITWAIALSILGFPLVYYAFDGRTYERFLEVRVSQVSEEPLAVVAERLDRRTVDLLYDLRHSGIEVQDPDTTVKQLAAQYDMPLRDFIHTLIIIVSDDKYQKQPDSKVTKAD
ncbi:MULTISPECIES: hypothetical protein [Pseudovibrio]|uniref:hypothetical protein n=1 Tax=Stappiaceae TaxID=2821832 RepID=UPI0023671C41|nr:MULTISPECIES: hypothetical protein [Pseudovibrio]MDD7911884.1 hypothetical protein [Pseudovibrio exalbescens]MDX5595450.1 hypothetical protein [Pseudovibrio sp. SPO723]